MINKALTIEDYQEYFVLDEITGDLFIRNDLIKHLLKLKADKVWLLMKIMFFNSENESEIEEHLEDIKHFEDIENLSVYTRKEYRGMRDALMEVLIERDGYFCQHCHSTVDITIDHIIPVIKGGKNLLSNLQLLCRSCNSKKGTKIMEDANGWLLA